MARDLRVLQEMARYRRLTGQQILTLLGFGSRQTLNYRLQRLWQHGYVERESWPTAVGSAPAVYRVAARGAAALAAESGGDLERFVSAGRSEDRVFLDHALATNDVLIAFELAGRAAGHRLEWSRPDKALDRPIDPLHDRQVIPLLPDARLDFYVGERHLRAYLEVDRGTETTTRFCRKVRGYLAYWARNTHFRQTGLSSFRLLVVVPSRKRLASLADAVAETVGKSAPMLGKDASGCLTILWYAVQGEVTPRSALNDPWLQAGRHLAFLPDDGGGDGI